MTPAQQSAFLQWWESYQRENVAAVEHSAALRRPFKAVADAYAAGHSAGLLEVVRVEERVRAERNELAEHLRQVLRYSGSEDAAAAARAYLRKIGAP